MLQLFLVALLDARQVGADDLVDLLLGQRAVGVTRAAAHADPDLVFAALQVVFIPTIGGSIGHRLLGMHVAPVGGGWVGPWRPIVRTVLLVLVVPALIWD